VVDWKWFGILSYWYYGGQDIDGVDTVEGYKGLEIVFMEEVFEHEHL
jgi:hypothetical protein